jgi:hypothetical protein
VEKGEGLRVVGKEGRVNGVGKEGRVKGGGERRKG